MGLFLIGPFSFAQSEKENSPPQESQIKEEHDTKNLDKLLIDYNKDQEKVLKDSNTLLHEEATGELSDKELGNGKVVNPPSSDEEKVKPFVKWDSQADIQKNKMKDKDLKKISYFNALKSTLEPLQKMREEELNKLLLENTKGTNAGKYIMYFPKISLFAVRLIKDPKALPYLGKIVDDQDKLIRFLGIMISTLLFGIVLKRMLKREGRSILMAVTFWFVRLLILACLRLGIIYYFYSSEISPTLSIAAKTFY
jgi:hypothetical protein